MSYSERIFPPCFGVRKNTASSALAACVEQGVSDAVLTESETQIMFHCGRVQRASSAPRATTQLARTRHCLPQGHRRAPLRCLPRNAFANFVETETIRQIER